MELQELNEAGLHLAQSFSSPALDLVFSALTVLGNPVFWVFVAALVFWKGEEKESFFLMNMVVFATALVGVLKSFFAVPRPSPENFRVVENLVTVSYGGNNYPDFAFPSGHTTTVTAAAVYLQKFEKKWLKEIFLAIVVAVAFSRMYLGQHFPLDVAGGLVLGVLVGNSNLLIQKRFEKSRFRLTKLREELALFGIIVASVAAIALFEAPIVSLLVLGYYAGFLAFKTLGFDSTRLQGSELLKKEALGSAGFLLLVGPALILGEALTQLLLFLFAGLWISLIFPAVYEKVLKKTPSK